MGKYTLVIGENWGGKATDDKKGIKNSFSYSRHLDFRKQPSKLTILPETVKETSTTVTGLVVDMLQLPSGKICAIDDAGGIYYRATDGTWTKDATTLTDTAYGMAYNFQHDRIYVPGQTAVHTIGPADRISATSSGPLSPGTTASDATVGTSAWTSPNDSQAAGDPSTYSLGSAANGAKSEYLKATNFGFAIPSGAVVTGIVVENLRKTTFASEAKDNSIKLVKGGTISGNDKAVATAWPTDFTTYASYGSSTDLWGLTWADTDINSSGFGVAISAEKTTSSGASVARIDHVRITVYYTLTAPVPASSTFLANVDQSLTGGANTYSSQASVTETATHRQTFTPTVDPLYSVKIKVVTKGSVELTVTVHDAANNNLGSKTLAVASITNGALNEFVFTDPIRVLAAPNAANYHFHVTHASGTASTVQATTASDLETADFETYGSRLIETNNGFHPVSEFLQYICFGNERYLTVWEPISQSAPSNTEWDRHRLIFPPGYEVTSLAVYSEYLAIACEKRSTTTTSEFQDGRIFFWDGFSDTYNFQLTVPEGSPYGLFSQKNVLYWLAGGRWWAWSGGAPVPLFQMPNTDFEFTDTETYMINYPKTMAVRNNILLAGFPSETNSQNVEHAVYSFGSRDKNYPESFGYSYSISTGTRLYDGANNLRIGLVKSFGDKLFIAWQDDSQATTLKYGVDIVDTSSDPFGTATWESLIFDHDRPRKEKLAIELTITFEALPTGVTITPKYDVDRSGTFTSGTAATAGATEIKLAINKRFHEIQLGMDLVATTATPEITSIELVFDDLKSEAI